MVREPQVVPAPLFGGGDQLLQGVDAVAVVGVDVEAPPDILRGNEARQAILPPGLDLPQALPQLGGYQGQSQAPVDVGLFPAGLEDAFGPQSLGGELQVMLPGQVL